MLPIYRVLVFQVDLVFVVPGQSQVIFVYADGLLIFVKEIQIFFFELIWYLEVATSGDVLLGQSGLRCVRDFVLDDGADSGSGLIREGVERVFFHLDDPHDVVPFNGDLVRGAVLNNDFAVLIVSMVTRDGTPVTVGDPGQWIVAM